MSVLHLRKALDELGVAESKLGREANVVALRQHAPDAAWLHVAEALASELHSRLPDIDDGLLEQDLLLLAKRAFLLGAQFGIRVQQLSDETPLYPPANDSPGA